MPPNASVPTSWEIRSVRRPWATWCGPSLRGGTRHPPRPGPPRGPSQHPDAAALVQRNARQWASVRDLHSLTLVAFEQDGAPLPGLRVPAGPPPLRHPRPLPSGGPPAQRRPGRLHRREAGRRAPLGFGIGTAFGCLSAQRVLVTFEGEVKLLPGVFRDLHTTPVAADAYAPGLPAIPPAESRHATRRRGSPPIATPSARSCSNCSPGAVPARRRPLRSAAVRLDEGRRGPVEWTSWRTRSARILQRACVRSPRGLRRSCGHEGRPRPAHHLG